MAIENHPFTSNRWKQNINFPFQEDKWFVHRNNLEETISFAFMPNKDVESIVLGTFPIWEITVGEIRHNNIEFFYGSTVNDLWNCFSVISELPIDSLINRFRILEELKLGMTDILETVIRNPSNCNGDFCLTAKKYNDILNLKDSFPSLKNIFITSGGKGPVGNINNNKNVASWLKDSLHQNNIQGFNSNGFKKLIKVNNFEFNLIYLYSPSGDANRSIQGVINKHNKFGIENLNISEFRKLQWGYFLKKYHLGEKTNPTINKIFKTVTNNQALLDFFNN
jgi:hypothetical protein